MKKYFTAALATAFLSFSLGAIGQDDDDEYDIGYERYVVIDTHAHILLPGNERGLNPNVDASPKELRRQMAAAGVGKAGIMAMVARDNPEAMREHNDYILDTSAASHDFFPIASVHPKDKKIALDEIRRVAARGAKALKLHPFYQGFDPSDPDVNAAVKLAGELGLTVIFDSVSVSDGGATGKFADLAFANPNTKIVLAHMSAYRFHEMIFFAILSQGPLPYSENVFFDLSATAELYADSPREDELLWTIRQIGIDQFLFASDFPIFNLANTRAAINKYGFTRKERKKLLHDNAINIFNLH